MIACRAERYNSMGQITLRNVTGRSAIDETGTAYAQQWAAAIGHLGAKRARESRRARTPSTEFRNTIPTFPLHAYSAKPIGCVIVKCTYFTYT